MGGKMRIGRHGNRITESGDSGLESRRRFDLELQEKRGEIEALEIQPKIMLVVNGQRVCTYKPDARYIEDGKLTVEDSKGHREKTYSVKAKLFMALYPGIRFAEYRKGKGRVFMTVTKGGVLKDAKP